MAVMEVRLDLLARQAFEHRPHHAQVDPRLARRGQEFVVLAHASFAPNPRDGALDDPAITPLGRFASLMGSFPSGGRF